MRWLLAVLLGAVAAPAWADGLTAAYAAFQAFWAAVGTYVYVAVIVYGTVNARRQARKAAARARNAYNAGLEDRSVTLLQAAPPWRICYGRCTTGGDIVAIFTTDKTATRPDGSAYTKADALKHMVIVFAAHECQAINEVFIDGVPVGTLDGNGQPTAGEFYSTQTETREINLAAGGSTTQPHAVTVLSSNLSNPPDTTTPVAASYTVTGGGLTINNTSGQASTVVFTMQVPKPSVRINKHLGSDTQTVDTYLNGVAPTQWTTNHRLRGLCYAVVTLDLEDPRFLGGPPNITVDLSGRLLLDTRTSTTAYSTNAALAVRDFLTAPWGYECVAADIDTPFCNVAANACDALISLDVGGVVTPNQPTYTCNGAFTTEAGREAVLEDLVECMAGFASYGAKWQIGAGVWTAPVMALGDDDLQGQIEVVQADAGMEEAFNGVRGVYIAAGKSSPTDFDPYQNATFLAADGVALWSDLTLPYTDNKARARNLSRIFVERARNALVIRFPARLKAWPLQVGDRVTVTSAEYGFAAKNFRVTDWQFGITSPVLLTLQEDEAAAYDLADAATADPAPNTNLPNPWAVATLTSVAAASGTTHLIKLPDGTIDTRVKVSWAAIADAYVTDGSGEVRILWRRAARDPANVYQSMSVPGTATDAYLTGLSAFDLLVIQVFAVNGLGARGNPVVLAHQVVGKSAAPANVADLTATTLAQGVRLSWSDNTEVDYESTELRQGASWAAGTRIFRGHASAYNWVNPAVGVYTVWAKHFDTTGNESATAVSVSATVLYQGDVNATVDLALVEGYGAGNLYDIAGNTVKRKTGGGAWADAVSSRDSYVGGASCSCRFAPNSYAIAGLGLLASSTTAGNYGFISRNDGNISARWPDGAGGTAEQLLQSGGIAGTEVLTVVYEGFQVKWYINGVLKWTKEWPLVPSGMNLRFVFSSVGAELCSGIRFGPLSAPMTISSLNRDPDCTDGSAWYYNGTTNVTTETTGGVTGRFALSSPDGGAGNHVYSNTRSPLDRTKAYRVRCLARKVGTINGAPVFYLGMMGFDSTGAPRYDLAPPYTGLAVTVTSGLTTSFTAFEFVLSAAAAAALNAGIVFISPHVILGYTGGGTAMAPGLVQVQDVRLEEIASTATIEPQAATTLSTAASTTGSGTVGAGTWAITRCTTTITNDQTVAIPVQLEVALLEAGYSYNVPAPTVARISYRYSSTTLGTVTRRLTDAVATLPAGGDLGSLGSVEQVSLAAGETLTLELLYEITNTANVSLSVGNSFARVALIKR